MVEPESTRRRRAAVRWTRLVPLSVGGQRALWQLLRLCRIPRPLAEVLVPGERPRRRAEGWHAKMWLDDADNIALYAKVWRTLRESTVYGAEAQNVINGARRALNPS
ncbi:hypothetical protein TUSST3_33190 [Streptomyces sp. TUS-ST3]|nr:hypothetical protein TUSST3_33190 [Streptomyces sp. TUS-ST3]